ncbi:MAG: nucleotide sugar dehydrogenase [Oligoflexales bacterium]
MEERNAVLYDGATIQEAIHSIDQAVSKGGESGIAVVLDSKKVLQGVITDGDIRGAICKGISFNKPVESIMSKYPVCIQRGFENNSARRILSQLREKKVSVSNVVLVDEENRYLDLLNINSLFLHDDVWHKKIAVYGLGFVGLTLALVLAEDGLFDVVGLDINKDVVNTLNSGKATFFEKGLQSLLEQTLSTEHLSILHAESCEADVHIISVGTPLDKDNKPDFSYLNIAARNISKVLKEHDLVICRSTVPAGTTRKFLIPLLEQLSGLKASKDFSVAFAPERTVEGNALMELRSLPQVVGGLTRNCVEKASALFKKITRTVIPMESLEAAEIVKLINNTYRDVIFSFANEVSYLCDNYNLEALKLISAANEGYPRNPIPMPSPGVGGICLSKDPYLYCYHEADNMFAPINYGKYSRETNQLGVEYVLHQIDRFMNMHPDIDATKVMIVGIAFKGKPETSDLRGSLAITLSKRLVNRGYSVSGFDAVVGAEEISKHGINPLSSLSEGFASCNIFLFMNNHEENMNFELFSELKRVNRPALFFDGWGQFNRNEIEDVPRMVYATMGYITGKD